MTPSEAITELEDTYDKNLTPRQADKYVRFLGKFNFNDIEKVTTKAIETCLYLPRISQLNDAAKDLLVLQPDRRVKADPGCEACQGTGWKYVEVADGSSGDLVEAVKRCNCRRPLEEAPF